MKKLLFTLATLTNVLIGLADTGIVEGYVRIPVEQGCG